LGSGEWPDLETVPLFSRRIMAACSPGLKKKFDFKKFSDLDGRTLIAHEHRPRSWENWAKALNIPTPKPGTVYRFDSMTAVVQAAVQGHGVALVCWPLSKNMFDSGVLVNVFDDDVDTGEQFYVAHRPGEQKREEVSRLMEWIIEEFQADR
jgi:LysR family glycine cleavage system transcriptional activator